ncbi:MAG: bacillithiol biosynthesis cysteine-adding enzyme BshC [Saprospiraceae bacterium]|jgi:bacillithiol biosynthesis cysteine-adding enzyme BshC
MKIEKIDYSKVSAVSFKDLAYIKLEPFLKEFYHYTPDLSSFSKAITDRKSKPIDRSLLASVLESNYSLIEPTALQKKNNISLRSENTFTIITAHQPSLFGGPLYYVLKVCSVINLCKKLKVEYPEYNFVPTFVSGGEDHDFEEVDHLNLFGKSVKWEREAKGPVGRLDIEGLQSVIDEVTEILGDNPIGLKLKSILNESLESCDNYGQFVFKFVNALFGKYGVLAVNMDNAKLKAAFAPVMKRELLERMSQPLVMSTQEKLSEHNFKAQAYPRDINLFYLGEGSRDRIEFLDGRYNIVDSDLSFSESEILKELDSKPENFSPNVVMRPLYQESILPNLAYVGGGGEIAYWLERKSQFAAFGVFYPMLIRRNSVMILNNGLNKTIDKLGFTTNDIFQTQDELINQYINANTEVQIELEDQKSIIQKAYEEIADKSKQIDPGLAKSVLADMTKQLKNIDQMESRMKRAIKSQQEVQVNKIGKMKDKLFPNNGLQERFDNFMPHYMSAGESFFDDLIDHLDPMDRRFLVLR